MKILWIITLCLLCFSLGATLGFRSKHSATLEQGDEK
jgi:hypothetical protein